MPMQGEQEKRLRQILAKALHNYDFALKALLIRMKKDPP